MVKNMLSSIHNNTSHSSRYYWMLFLVVYYLLFYVIPSTKNNNFLVDARSREFETTREEILESRKRRSKQLEIILEESKARLNDHNNRRKLLTDSEKHALEKKISIYTRKLETLQADLDEREVQRIIEKERLRNQYLQEKRAREEL